MAIAHSGVDQKASIGSITATTTITLASTTSTDVNVVIFGNNHSATTGVNAVTAPSGWSAIFTGFTETDGSSLEISLYGFWAFGNVANKGFSNSVTGDSQGWVCVAFSGVDQGTPIDAVSGTNNVATGVTSITVSSVTIVTANAWELIGAVDWQTGTFSATGYTDVQSTTNCAGALLYNTTPKTTGPTATVTLNDSIASNTICAKAFALRPATAAVQTFESAWYFNGKPKFLCDGIFQASKRVYSFGLPDIPKRTNKKRRKRKLVCLGAN